MKKIITDDDKIRADKQVDAAIKKIDYFISEYTIELLNNKFDKNDIIIPDYQRNFIWDDNRKCRFIESLLIGLPIPFLFFWERKESGVLEVVDGSQRIRTINSFLNNEFELVKLERLTLLNGFKYEDLTDARKRKLYNRTIRGIILSEKADLQARLDLFERINTGSKNANYTEIRRALLSGDFMDFIIQLSSDNDIISLLPVSDQRLKEREREELVTRFFAYGDGLDDYSDTPNEFLFKYIQKMNEEFKNNKNLKEKYTKRIKKVFNVIDKYFPYGFRKDKNSKTVPRARYESISIGIDKILQETSELNINWDNVTNILNDPVFKKVIRSDGANTKKRLSERINIFYEKLLEIKNE